MFDMELSPDTVLQLAPGIRTRWNAAGHVVVDSPVGTIIDIGPRGFGILSLFSQPTRLGDAIDRLEHEHQHSTDLAPTLSVLNMLSTAEQDYAEPAPPAPPPPAPSAADATGELERLASLHESGALSDEEFAAAKQQVISA